LHKEIVFINLLGVSDSVKVFSLSRKDADGNLVSDDINDKEFKLSAHDGLTLTFDNYLFPKVIMEQHLVECSGSGQGVKTLMHVGPMILKQAMCFTLSMKILSVFMITGTVLIK